MSCTAREYLGTLDNFTRIPDAKEEVWRFSKLDSWLDRIYKDKTEYISNENILIDTVNYICIKNGQIIKQILPKTIKINTKDNYPLQSVKNPYLGLISNICPYSIKINISKTLDKALLIHYIYDNKDILASSVKIVVNSNVDVNIVEHFEGADDSLIFHHTTLKLENEASCSINTLQNLEDGAALISHIRQELSKVSKLKQFILFQGSGFNKHFIESNLCQESSNELNILMNSKAAQQHLINTVFTHQQKDTKSLQKAKELLKDSSVSLFDARSIILKEAVNSDVRQENRGLMLSQNSRLYAKPHLEIFTDELRASHGATVGELDIEALNYLHSRGVSKEKSHDMLVDAFIEDILMSIDNEEFLTVIKAILHKGVNDEKY